LKKVISKLINNFSGNRSSINSDFKEIQKIIKYEFKDQELLTSALSHTSLTTPNNKATSFERMEFLGDSILGMVVAEELFKILFCSKTNLVTRYIS